MTAEKKSHFAVLDGVRGCAALSVLFFHLGHWMKMSWLATNSGLAVDLFFCLSGFVLNMAYDRRLRSDLTPMRFFTLRLVRLMPLIILGSMVSFVYVALRLRAQGVDTMTLPLLLALVGGVTGIPYIGAPTEIGGPQIFPLNGPQYSLFLELVINVLWAMTYRLPLAERGRDRLFAALICISLILIGIYGGGGDKASSFLQGFPRVTCSFLIGVLLHKNLKRAQAAVPMGRFFPWMATGMILLFFAPFHVPAAVEMLWIVIGSPMVVASGAQFTMSGPVNRILLLGGELSYPIYALHYPIFCWINGLYITAFHARSPALESVLIVTGVVGLSLFALRRFDEPVRRRLSAAL